MTDAENDLANGTARGIRLCIYDGDVETMPRYSANVPWKHLLANNKFDELINNAGLHLTGQNAEMVAYRSDAVLSMLLGWAIRDHQPLVFELKNKPPLLFPQPVHGILEKGLMKSLAKFLDSGFDPRAEREPAYLTALQMAERLGKPDMANAMVSHGARSRAHDLLANMFVPPASSRGMRP